MNIDFANSWAKALTSDIDLFVSMYADEPVIEFGSFADAAGEAILSREALRREMSRFTNADLANGLGIHEFRAYNFEGHDRHGIIQWLWKGEGLDSFRGLDPNGQVVSAVGQSFQQYDAQGRIVREITYWADLAALLKLGV